MNTIKGIIWDLDNTLYRFSDAFKHVCNKAAAKAAIDIGLDMSFDDALHIAERSETEHGYSMHGYVTDHGLSIADLHFPFHANIDERIIAPFDGLSVQLRALEVPQVILTNASRCWARRALTHIGADDIFDEGQVIAIEDVDFEPKARSEKGFLRALELLNLPAGDVLMVDDLDRNLAMAHRIGFKTAYIHYDDPVDGLPDFMTAQYEDIMALLEEYLLT